MTVTFVLILLANHLDVHVFWWLCVWVFSRSLVFFVRICVVMSRNLLALCHVPNLKHDPSLGGYGATCLQLPQWYAKTHPEEDPVLRSHCWIKASDQKVALVELRTSSVSRKLMASVSHICMISLLEGGAWGVGAEMWGGKRILSDPNVGRYAKNSISCN